MHFAHRTVPCVMVKIEVKIMDSWFIFAFLAFTLLSSFNCRNSTKGMIDQIGINKRFYPSHYIRLQSSIRNLFNINNKEIPKFLFCQLIICILFAILGPIYIIIYLYYSGNNSVGGMLLLFHASLVIVNLAFFSVMSTIFKHK